MRFLPILFAATAAVTAQSPLTTTFASNNGQAGNMFDLRPISAPITVDDFDVNLDTGTWDIEVYTVTGGGSHVGLEQNAGAWTLVATVPGVVSLGQDVPTPLGQQLNINCPPGVNTGVYVTVTNGTAINYTTGTGFVVGDVYAADSNLEFLAGTGNVYPFGAVFGPPSSTRIWNGNIYYTVASGNFPSVTSFGAGCGGGNFASIYEQIPSANMDLDGFKIDAINTGAGYLIQTLPGAGGIAAGANAVIMPLGDDDSQDTATVGGTLGLWVGSNCWIALGGGNSNGFSPSSSTMLSNPSTGVYAWTDLRPLQPSGVGLGTVYYEENGTVATVTYDAVEGWNTGTTNTVQITYDAASGDYSITFGALSTTNPEDWLVGYSVGGASVDPGPTDISAGAFSTPAADTPAMALSSDLPNVGQDWTLDLDNVSGPFCWFFFGDAAVDPGYDLTPNGAPGCFVYSTANLGFWVQPILSGTGSMSFGIPADSSLVGTELTAQGAALVPSNALNFGTSNGISAKVGS